MFDKIELAARKLVNMSGENFWKLVRRLAIIAFIIMVIETVFRAIFAN